VTSTPASTPARAPAAPAGRPDRWSRCWSGWTL
jgi:hypothetical protein